MIWFKKLKLLLWKNAILQSRHILQTIFELLAPVLFSLLLVLARCLVSPVEMPEQDYLSFEPMKLRATDTFLNVTNARSATVAFSPETSLTREVTINAIRRIVDENFRDTSWPPWLAMEAISPPQGFSSRELMEAAMTKPGGSQRISCGIVFDPAMINMTRWPDDVEFSIRFPATMRTLMLEHPISASWRTNMLFPLLMRAGPRDPDDPYGGRHPGYYYELFLGIQQAISDEIMIEKTGAVNFVKNAKVVMRRFPHDAYKDDKLLLALERFMSFVVMISFMYPAIATAKMVAMEKELQLKETMTIMGLPSSLQWLAWFIKQFIFLSISGLSMTILFKIPFNWTADGIGMAVLTYTPWSIILFFMLLFIAATIAFCFMVSVFFNEASTASSFMSIAWLITYSGYMVTLQLYEQTTFATKIGLSLMSNSAFAFALQMIVNCEGSTRGLQWADLFKPVSYHDTFTPGHVMLMLIFDAFLYMTIALYVERIWPGAYGVPLPWYFPLTKNYWFEDSRRVGANNNVTDNADHDFALLKIVHDDEPQNGIIGVNIKKLTKMYDQKKKAVDNLSLRLYENEITVLLGHNGAGKTSTISMLTGMIPPTSGSASISGYDIVRDTRAARRSLGLCPQHNVLFPDLTVAEHIKFYSQLKGLDGEDVTKEVEHFVTILGLEKKRDTQSRKLSGGQKRRLSVCAAMCGNSKVVLLDEPSSGLDPVARRALWDLLLQEKKGRTILLSTHFMDEADVLGDRVAIMAGGRLQCVGTPLFLKKHYGAGYKLTVVKGNYCKKYRTLKLLKKYVPQAELKTDIGTELIYTLPHESVSEFQHLLKELETRMDELGIASFGMSITTLEEVFMKAGAEDTVQDSDASPVPTISSRRNSSLEVTDVTKKTCLKMPIDKVKGTELQLNHVKGMFLKMGLSILRNRLQNIIQILIPIINVVLTITVIRSWKFIRELPRLKLSLDSGFFKTQTLLRYSKDLKKKDPVRHMMYAYRDLFLENPDPRKRLIELGEASIKEAYLKMATENPRAIRYEVLTGASFEQDQITAWFSNYGYHDSAISLAMVNNAKMRALWSNSSITVYNDPLPYTLQHQMRILLSGGSVGMQFAINMGSCMAFVCAFIVLFSIKERVNGAKLMQRVCGVKPIVMWGCAYIVDWLWLMFITLIIVITIGIFQEQTLSTFSELGRLTLVFMLFHLASIPLHYLASLAFGIPATGFTTMCYFNSLTGVMAYLTTEIMAIPELGSPYYYKLFDNIFAFMPSYSLSRCIKTLSDTSFAIQACDGICERYMIKISNCTRHYLCTTFKMEPCCVPEDPYFLWEQHGIGRYLTVMLAVALVAFAILMIIEYEPYRKYMKKYVDSMTQRGAVEPVENEDSDVQAERLLAQSIQPEDRQAYSLVTQELTKYYKNNMAVDRLSFVVRKGECFGLLGVNGAGKTTTFKMLTGDLPVTSGDAWVQGESIITNLRVVHQNIAYCPQFDALLENLTGRETMRIYCLLRGIPVDIGTEIAEDLTKKLGMQKHLDKMVNQYSGGTKRKLSTALALLGDAPLVFLDEPTTGMDPASKRLVWRVILDALDIDRPKLRARTPSTSSVQDNISIHSKDSITYVSPEKNNKLDEEWFSTRSSLPDEVNEDMMVEEAEVDSVGTYSSRKGSDTKSKTSKRSLSSGSASNTPAAVAEGNKMFSSKSRGIVLTSHSMEECEALCSRLTVMVGGKLQCLGSLQHLKNKFSTGYTVTMKCGGGDHRDMNVKHVHSYVAAMFPVAKLVESYQGISTYYIPDKDVAWSEVFKHMETVKARLSVEDYTITQTTLEQVFLMLTKEGYRYEDDEHLKNL